MDDLEKKIRDITEQILDENTATNQFAVSQTPYHTHNGSDSQKVSYQDLTERDYFLSFTLPGIQGRTSNNWGVIFTVPFSGSIVSATEIHQTAEATATTMTVQIEKLIGTQASGAGTTLLLTPFDLKGTANTLQTGMLNTTSAKTGTNSFNFAPGDRIGLVLTTTGAASADLIGVNIIIQLQY